MMTVLTPSSFSRMFGDHFRAGSADDGVVAPDFQLAVDAGQVGVIAVDHGDALGAGGVQQAGGRRDDGTGAVATDRAGHEVVEHVNDQDGGMIQLFHIVFGK